LRSRVPLRTAAVEDQPLRVMTDADAGALYVAGRTWLMNLAGLAAPARQPRCGEGLLADG